MPLSKLVCQLRLAAARYADHDQKCKCLWLYCNQRLWYWQQNQQSYHNASQWCRLRRFYYSWTKYGSRKHRAGEENLPLFIKNVHLIFTYSGIHFFKTPCFPDYGIILFNRCQSHPSGCRLFIHYCILVLYNVSQGLFQGCGHTLITMLVDASRIWIFRLLSLWICANVFHMGVASVWYSVVISNGTSAIILYLLYWTGIWKKGYADPL